jgi:hypothetical protein
LKSSGSCLENREYGSRDPSRWPRGTLYPQTLAITSPTAVAWWSVEFALGLRPWSFFLLCYFILWGSHLNSLNTFMYIFFAQCNNYRNIWRIFVIFSRAQFLLIFVGMLQWWLIYDNSSNERSTKEVFFCALTFFPIVSTWPTASDFALCSTSSFIILVGNVADWYEWIETAYPDFSNIHILLHLNFITITNYEGFGGGLGYTVLYFIPFGIWSKFSLFSQYVCMYVFFLATRSGWWFTWQNCAHGSGWMLFFTKKEASCEWWNQ